MVFFKYIIYNIHNNSKINLFKISTVRDNKSIISAHDIILLCPQ